MVTANSTSSGGCSVPPSQAIVEAIADAEGVTLYEVKPPAYDALYAVVDPEALDSLFGSAGDRGTSDLRVAFTYEGYEVVVEGGGRIGVTVSAAADATDTLIEE